MSSPVAVAGLWHLGTVTAACLASRDIPTLGYDADRDLVERVAQGGLPVLEPGLGDLVQAGLQRDMLHFTSKPADIACAEILWATWDTPMDCEDRADVEFVIGQLMAVFPYLRDGCLVLLSSQVPVGTTRRLEEAYTTLRPSGRASFAYIPENLRLGSAIDTFAEADRIVVGVRSERDADRVRTLLAPFPTRIEVMRVESAELTKHALNAFLAMSVAFTNEVARLGERVGADGREVERALKSDVRIGRRAYLRPGGAYAGGTLARDVNYMIERGEALGCDMPLFRGVHSSNLLHSNWIYDRLRRILGTLTGVRIAILGLTYKSGTDTLRRSPAVALCERLAMAGATVLAHDPAVEVLPDRLSSFVQLSPTAQEIIREADAVVIATEWPQFLELTAEDFVCSRDQATVIDPGGFLASALEGDSRIRYAIVGGVP